VGENGDARAQGYRCSKFFETHWPCALTVSSQCCHVPAPLFNFGRLHPIFMYYYRSNPMMLLPHNTHNRFSWQCPLCNTCYSMWMVALWFFHT